MVVYIEGEPYEFEFGCRILKTRFGLQPFQGLEENWDSIPPITMEDLVNSYYTPKERRKIVEYVGPEFIEWHRLQGKINSETIKKRHRYLDQDQNMVEFTYEDTIQLFRIDGEKLFQHPKPPKNDQDIEKYDRWLYNYENKYQWINDDLFYVKYKEPMTGKDLYRWVDMESLLKPSVFDITAIDALASTYKVPVKINEVSEVIKMGQLTLYKWNENSKYEWWISRKLRSNEYINGIIHES